MRKFVKLCENVLFAKESFPESMTPGVTLIQPLAFIRPSEAMIIVCELSVAEILGGLAFGETLRRISLVTTAGPHALSWIIDVLVIGGVSVIICRAKSRGIPRFSRSYEVAMDAFKSSIVVEF